jgi:hypothetical protein
VHCKHCPKTVCGLNHNPKQHPCYKKLTGTSFFLLCVLLVFLSVKVRVVTPSRGLFFKGLNYLKSPEFSWKLCFFGSENGQLNKFETSKGGGVL